MMTVRLNHLKLAAGQWVLDVGCGEGRHVHAVQYAGGVNIVGIDIDEEALFKARQGANGFAASGDATTALMKADAYQLPFADATFDVVICSEVLEHLADYAAAIGEIRRVLKPGGIFAPTVPRAWPERLCWTLAPGAGGYADQPGGHVRIFAERQLRAAIETSGFRYLRKHYAHGLHAPYWWLKCALWRRRDDHPLVRLYHRFLVWDILKRPRLTRALDAALTPVMGKSLVFYFRAAFPA